MNRNLPSVGGTDTAGPDRQDFESALLEAADEDAAAILEQARRDITVIVHRARRDLHLVRAQLQACGVSAPQLPAFERLESGEDPLDPAMAHEGVIGERAGSLEHIVSEANSKLVALTGAPAAETPDVRTGDPVARPTAPERRSHVPAMLGVAALVLLIGGAIAGWLYSRGDAVSVGPDRATSSGIQSPAGATGTPATAPVPAAGTAANRPAASGVVVLQTIRPVWMRIEVDGGSDVGRVYPQGTIREVRPTEAVSIRAGDAGAVSVSVDGAPPAPLGGAGQVLTRRIFVRERPPSQRPVSAPTASGPAGSPLPSSVPLAPVPEVVLPQSASPPPPAGASAPPSGRGGVVTPSDLHSELLAKHELWLNAYSRGDRQAVRALTTADYSVLDLRPAAASNAAIPAPEVFDIRVDAAGSGAVLTGRMRTRTGGVATDSLLSEVWVRDAQQRWTLMGVRITPAERVEPSGGSNEAPPIDDVR